MKVTSSSAEPEFKPFSVTIEFETPEEAVALCCVLNHGAITTSASKIAPGFAKGCTAIRAEISHRNISTASWWVTFCDAISNYFKDNE